MVGATMFPLPTTYGAAQITVVMLPYVVLQMEPGEGDARRASRVYENKNGRAIMLNSSIPVPVVS